MDCHHRASGSCDRTARKDAVPVRDLKRFVVLAFGSTHESLAAEDALLDAGFTVKVMPLPRTRGSLCGIALRLPPEERHPALAELARHGLVVAALDEIEDV